MLPGTQMHLITFGFVCVEVVIFFYLLIYKFARPDDNKTLLNVLLVFLLLIYNITGGLLPDPNLPGSVFVQEAIAYGTGFITPSYFPYYVYKAFGLTKMRFHAFRGIYICLIVPYMLFVTVYGLTGNLDTAKNLLILPVLYAIWVIVSLVKALKYKYKGNFPSRESREEFIGLLLSLTPWVGLPAIDFFNLGQDVEASVTNTGFLLLLALQLKNHIVLLRQEHERLVLSEKMLLNWNSSLQEEVERRTSQIKSIIQQRTNTLVNLAHETKTPLTLIANYLEEYTNKNGDSSELSVVKRSVGKITSDISNIFDLERLNRGLSLYNQSQVTSFTDLISDNLALYEGYARRAELSISAAIEKDLYIKADPLALNRVVTNLVENAIKFSTPGGTIEIVLKKESAKIVFSVKDAGPGIAPDMHKKIFEPYFQLNNPKHSHQGMGLGLPLVKQVIQELHGTIVVQSDPRKARGTTMVVTLLSHELSKGEELSSIPKTPAADKDLGIGSLHISKRDHDPNKKTILIVEDNISMVNYLQKKLLEKYNLILSLNGQDALKVLFSGSSSVDLIISDVMMDGVDGFRFLERISGNPSLSHIPFLFLSAKATPTDRLTGLKLGAIDFIQKPFSMQELMQRIESILAHEEKRQAAILSMALDHLSLMRGKSGAKPGNVTDKFEANCNLYQLTSREREIARLLCEGKRHKEIGDRLFISERTVAKHVQNIFEKVNVTSKVELINTLAS